VAIVEVRLSGAGFELGVSEAGAHQLGRSSESAVRVDHPTVSRRHARLILSEDRSTAYVQDLGGANGTWLNGAAVERLAPLREGDTIRVGEVELRVTFRRA
jgi:pSer/pThr/pTyr-binding forkhead associated (FHA) protein